MAAMDFMHKQLINAASKDALGSIGMGAGIGAGVGAANALITGNDSLLGGATSGAMLGAAGGAGMRYAGTKYGAGMADIIGDGARKDTGKFATSTFSRPEAKPFNFWKNSDADDAAMARVRANVVEPGSGKGPAAATGSDAPEAGPIKTVNEGPKGKSLKTEAALQNAKRNGSSADEDAALRMSQAEARNSGRSTPNQEAQERLKTSREDAPSNNSRVQNPGRDFARNHKATDSAKDRRIDRAMQSRFNSEVANDIRSVDGDLSRMGNFNYTPNEIAAGFKKTGKTVDEWSQSTRANAAQAQSDRALIDNNRKEAMRSLVQDQGNRIPGLSNSKGPSGSLDDVFKFMNGV